jgi:hypothetical protein
LLAVDGAVVLIETVVVMVFSPFGVTVLGEKLHDDSLGNPEQANDTCWLNPKIGATLTVAVALAPCPTLIVPGTTLRLKPGDPSEFAA